MRPYLEKQKMKQTSKTLKTKQNQNETNFPLADVRHWQACRALRRTPPPITLGKGGGSRTLLKTTHLLVQRKGIWALPLALGGDRHSDLP